MPIKPGEGDAWECEEEDFYDLIQPNEALLGSASGEGSSEADELLLSLSGEITRLHVLLIEVDPRAFKRLTVRLQVLRTLVQQLPREAVQAGGPPVRLGFNTRR